MKNTLLTLIATTVFIFSGRSIVSAQPMAAKPAEIAVNTAAATAISMENYESFKKSIQPLIAKMSEKQIVGLGEGTHGTAEFYKVRGWISRILIEEKGFNHIAFENDFSDSWLLNAQLNTTANLDSLMKKHLLKIWQNEETKELLTWVKQYNTTHKNKVTIDGIDYVYLTPDVKMLRSLLANTPAKNIIDSLTDVEKAAVNQDTGWLEENQPLSTFDFKAMDKRSAEGYKAAVRIEKLIAVADLPADVKNTCQLALANIKQGFAPFYNEFANLPEVSRDSSMAYTTSMIMKAPGAKMIIWAHDVHLAKTGIYDNEVGGTGGLILKMFPNNYFGLGTGTASGTFAATKDPHDTYTNVMLPSTLETPVKDSWDELLSAIPGGNFYFDPQVFNPGNAVKQIRFIGYGPNSGPTTYDKTNLSDLYDAYLFIKDTHAATPLK